MTLPNTEQLKERTISSKVALVEDSCIVGVLFDAIKNAEKTIKIAIYLCTLDYKLSVNSRSLTIIKALCCAAERGVAVHIVLGQPKNLFLEQLNRITCNYMKNRGVIARIAYNSPALHSKLLIIDDEFSIIGNHNYTERSFTKNHEVSLAVWDKPISTKLSSIHNRYWKSSSSSTEENSKDKDTNSLLSEANEKTDPFHRICNYQSDLARAWQTCSKGNYDKLFDMSLTPDNISVLEDRAYFDYCNKEINSAKKAIVVSMALVVMTKWEQHPTNSFVNSLIEAHKRGIDINIFTSFSSKKKSMSFHNQAAITKLQSHDIKLHLLPEHIRFHHKMVLLDGILTIIGSHNWTSPSLKDCSEISLAIESNPMYERSIQAISNLSLLPA